MASIQCQDDGAPRGRGFAFGSRCSLSGSAWGLPTQAPRRTITAYGSEKFLIDFRV